MYSRLFVKKTIQSLYGLLFLFLSIESFGEIENTFQNGVNGYTGCIDNYAFHYIKEVDIANEPNPFYHSYSEGTGSEEKLTIESFHTDKIT